MLENPLSRSKTRPADIARRVPGDSLDTVDLMLRNPEFAVFFDAVISMLGKDNPGPGIDLGCGPGLTTAYLSRKFPQCQLWGVDKNEEDLGFAGEFFGRNIRWERMNLSAVNRLPRCHFKWATLISVLGYMSDKAVQKFLPKLPSILLTSGQVVAVVYHTEYDRDRGFPPEGNPHAVHYGMRSSEASYWSRPAERYIEFFKRAGFKVESPIEVPTDSEQSLFRSSVSKRMFSILNAHC